MSQTYLCIPGMLATAILCSAQPIITEYSLPAGGNEPREITTGPDGRLWFTEGVNRIGRITTAGVINELTFGTNGSGRGITLGPDGNIWFIKSYGPNSLIQVTPAGVFTEFAAPWSGAFGGEYITTGPDGNLWATGLYSIHKLAPNGSNYPGWLGEYVVPNAATVHPWVIAPGPDGNLWYTQHGDTTMGKITPAGAITNFPLSFSGYLSYANRLTPSPEGRLWFTGGTNPCSGQKSIGRILTIGMNFSGTDCFTPGLTAPQYFDIGLLNINPTAMTPGPDGNLWFTGTNAGGPIIGRIAPRDICYSAATCAGKVAVFPVSDGGGTITVGPDGNLWFTEPSLNRIARAVLPGVRVLNVSSTNDDGVYGPGANIAITLTFSGAVIVAGVPKLPLNSGGVATYTSGSGTNTLTFIYTVGTGQSTSRLDAASPMGIIMNSDPATIKDTSGNPAIAAVPVYPVPGSLAANKAIFITPAIGCTLPFCVLPLKLNSGGNNGTVTTQITGAGFIPGAIVKLSQAGQPDIIATPANVGPSGTTIGVTFDLHGTASGAWDVVVTNPDGTSVRLGAGFTVASGAGAQVWTDVIGPLVIRTGVHAPPVDATYTIYVGNRGNVDARGVAVWLAGMPKDVTFKLSTHIAYPPQPAGQPPVNWPDIPVFVDYTTKQPEAVLQCGSGGQVCAWQLLPQLDPVQGKALPLYIPLIAPGALTTIEVKLLSPPHSPFRLYTWASRPAFQSPISGDWFNPTAGTSCLSDLSNIALDVLGVAVPGTDAARCSVKIAGSVAGLLGDINSAAGDPSPLNLFQILADKVDTATTIAECTIGVLPGFSQVVSGIQGAMDLYSAFSPFGDGGSCLKAWGIISPRTLDVIPVESADPNDKVGSSIAGDAHYISGDEPLRYAIYFENVNTATAPAQTVVITDRLGL